MADPAERRRHGLADESGNAMILMPIGVLIMLMLAGIAVDTALAHRSQARLENVAAALANDVAGAVDTSSLFDDSDAVEVDRGLLDRLAAVHASTTPIANACTTQVVTSGAQPEAVATCAGTGRTLFRGLAGRDNGIALTATERVILRND